MGSILVYHIFNFVTFETNSDFYIIHSTYLAVSLWAVILVYNI